MNAQRCGNCLFFRDAYETGEMDIEDDSPEVRGSCRRFPPQVVYNPGEEIFESNFPEVDIDEWCGELKLI